MNAKTVFSENRWERDEDHLYFLPDDVFQSMEQPKSAFLVGTRGTGKTTLLKALNWKEGLTNKSLQRALGRDTFGKKYIGVYMRLARELPNYFGKRLSDGQQFAATLFTLYIDCVWIEAVAEAISALIVTQSLKPRPIFRFDPTLEFKYISEVFDKFPKTRLFELRKSDYTFANYAKIIHELRKQLERDVLLSTDISSLLKQYSSDQFGSFGQFIGKIFGDFCDKVSLSPGKWHFKICIDEPEWFTDEQKRIINTVVKLAEWPCFFILAHVRSHFGHGDISSTTSPNVSLTDDDRTIIDLDSLFGRKREFYEGVATVRVRNVLKNNKVKFELRKILSELNINFLLEQIIHESKSDKAARWLILAKALAATPFWKAKLKAVDLDVEEVASGSVKESGTPIYQAYQIEKLAIQIPEPETLGWEKRGQLRAELRKRMVASYLCLCNDLKRIDVLYAHDRMVVGMSDGCIRTFLQIMHELYTESGRSLLNFLREPLSYKTQHKAILRASTNKRQAIPSSRVRYPNEVGGLVECLGKIVHSLQSEGPGNAPLRSNERGLFKVSLDLSIAEMKYILDGADNGYIRLVSVGDAYLVFRLHNSLAAYFKFSYRGAYSITTALSWDDIRQMIACESERRDDLAKQITARLANAEDPRQLGLFKELDYGK
jgi:hypothetical protein